MFLYLLSLSFRSFSSILPYLLSDVSFTCIYTPLKTITGLLLRIVSSRQTNKQTNKQTEDVGSYGLVRWASYPYDRTADVYAVFCGTYGKFKSSRNAKDKISKVKQSGYKGQNEIFR